MKQLIETLRTETQTLKETYFEMTKKWAESYFERIMLRKNWKEVDWCKYFGLTPELKNKGLGSCEFYSFPDGFYNTRDAREYQKYRNEISSLNSMGVEKYKEKELKKAQLHYESSLLKLAARIDKKGLNIKNMKIVTGNVGVNIEMTLSDGEKSVRAWTIIAEGIVQRPHYRYLVK